MDTSINLTKKQQEVTNYLVSGYSKKEIAHSMKLSTRTVENHLRSIYERALVNSATQLSVWYYLKFHGVRAPHSLPGRVVHMAFKKHAA